MNVILYSVLVLGGLGAAFGAFLAFASRIFVIEENPVKAKIMTALPGANCGACGFPGCEGYADWLVKSSGESVSKCTVGGADSAGIIAALFGKTFSFQYLAGGRGKENEESDN